MKPMGRKYFKGNNRSKHHVKIKGKYHAWWLDVCTPNKVAEKKKVKEDIKNDCELFFED